MKYIQLMNGDEMEIYDYRFTNCLIVRFISDDLKAIKDFFGDSIIKEVSFYDENHNLIETKNINAKYTSVYTERSDIEEIISRKVSDEYDELVEDTIGYDEDENPIIEQHNVHHEAVYDRILVTIPTDFIVVILDKPSINDTVAELQNLVGVPDLTSLDLDGWKHYKQEENKKMFAEFLDKCYVTINGKNYGVTEEDQNEMSLNYMQYMISRASGLPVTLEWHAKKEKCIPMTEEEFLTISMTVKAFVYPYYNLMQQYKEAIFNSNSIQEVKAIICRYEVM